MRLIFVGVLSPLLFLAACGSMNQHEKALMQSQLARIDGRVDTLVKGAKGQAELASNLAELRRAVVTMTGQVEEFNERARQLTDRITTMESAFTEMSGSYRKEAQERSADTNMKLAALREELTLLSIETRAFIKLMEKKSGITSRSHRQAIASIKKELQKGNQAPVKSGNKSTALFGSKTSSEPDDLYQQSYNLYLKGDFESSVASFVDYLRRYPHTSLSDNAAFWIGESYFSMKQYGQAAIAFDKTARIYPASVKAPIALLRAADSFIVRNEKQAAIVRLKQIIEQYPTSNEALTASDRLALMGKVSDESNY